MVSPISIAQRLRSGAERLLYHQGVDALLQEYGDVFYTGSYRLNLMAWPDIDISLVPREYTSPLEAAAELARGFILRDDSKQVKFGRNLKEKIPALPQGLYVGVRVASEEVWPHWKLDIWIVDHKELQDNRAVMERIGERLTASNREKILEWKQRLMTPAGRTPSLSGYWLYEAILFEGLEREEDIIAYLQNAGVTL